MEVPCHCCQKRKLTLNQLDLYKSDFHSKNGIVNNTNSTNAGINSSTPMKYFHGPEYMEKFSESRRNCFKNPKSLANKDFDSDEIVRDLREDIFGEDNVFQGPYGPRKTIYMDHAASGKSLKSIEHFLQENVLPVYSTTLSKSSHSGSQMSAYRTESRKLIMKLCGASTEDVLIFCGSGDSAAVHNLVHSIQYPEEPAPIVFVGPFEHRTNLTPWRYTTSEIINIPEDAYGTIDIKFLEDKLKKAKSNQLNRGRLLVGIFSAASHVTGALTDDVAITIMMHTYGGLALWDYSAAAPHVKISMNPQTGDQGMDELAKKDALFFSGHKFIGGPQSTGVLIAKKNIFRNPVPHAFVSKQKPRHYLDAGNQKEDAGRPDIIGSIRLGLVFQLKNTIGEAFVITREAFYTKKALESWETLPQIKILGHKKHPRIPIISFMIQHLQTGYFLHHDFVIALLNDLFGIQVHGGCLCAGSYAEGLLGIDSQLKEEYSKIITSISNQISKQGNGIFKPGFIRISLPFHASKEEIDFVIEAVKLVAEHGWKLLPFYKFNPSDGSFYFHANQKDQEHNKPIDSFHLLSSYPKLPVQEFHPTYEECLKFAQDLVESVPNILLNFQMPLEISEELLNDSSPQTKKLRWFLLPSEALNCLQKSKLSKEPVQRSSQPFILKNHYKSRRAGEQLKYWQIGSIPNQICSKSCWIEDKAEFHHKLDRISKRFKIFKILDRKLGLKDSEDEWGGYASDDGFVFNRRGDKGSRSRSGSISSVFSSNSSNSTGFHDDYALRR